jgi:hypothetical protein
VPFLLCSTAAKALATPVETTLRALLIEYGSNLDLTLLESLQNLRSNFDHYNIVCLPEIGEGDLDDPRVIRAKESGGLESTLKEISNLETATVEFKSSFQVDLKRKKFDPGRSLTEYKSEEVLKSALKSIAAFANGKGGSLYLGVTDCGEISGLSDDFVLANASRCDFDGWDQYFRNIVRTRSMKVMDFLHICLRVVLKHQAESNLLDWTLQVGDDLHF